mmetsp:Transcript_10294/g.19759  ORF Transcript_10294/g.19759 Transcript_10294/m.19759 type:complete len:86 (-) Transcript_10294:95-352(-)
MYVCMYVCMYVFVYIREYTAWNNLQQDIAVTWEEVGLAEKEDAEMKVRDLWKHEDLGTFTGGFTAKAVRSTSAVVIRVSPVSSYR